LAVKKDYIHLQQSQDWQTKNMKFLIGKLKNKMLNCAQPSHYGLHDQKELSWQHGINEEC